MTFTIQYHNTTIQVVPESLKEPRSILDLANLDMLSHKTEPNVVESCHLIFATHPSPIENWAFADIGAPEKLKFLLFVAAAADVGTLVAAAASTELTA